MQSLKDHKLSPSFCGSGVRAQFSQILCSGSRKPEIKVLAWLGSYLEFSSSSKFIQVVGRVQFLATVVSLRLSASQGSTLFPTRCGSLHIMEVCLFLDQRELTLL